MMTAPTGGRSTAPATWLDALRIYLGVIALANLAWESVQLPLYTIWSIGTVREQAFAVLHCTMGDVVIAACALALALVVAGDAKWPIDRFLQVAVPTVAFGVVYTVFSEWLNVVVRATWAYSDLMPIVPIAGLKIGLSPLLQWMIVPAVAFAITRGVTTGQTDGGPR